MTPPVSHPRTLPPAGPILLTYEDYCALPDDGKRYELLEGVLQVTPSPTTRHQRVSRQLEAIVLHHVEAHGLGEVFDAPIDVVLSPSTVVQPDLVFVSRERGHIITEKNIAGAPDLVVEILSSSSAQLDRGVKAQLYARHGVRYYWLVDPDAETLEEYELRGDVYELSAIYKGDTTCTPRCFHESGLVIDLSKVWKHKQLR